ncbi:putative acetyltransferase [Catenuloplanes nepalensis]|uniref:Acetyltransferase n=1 Tax=Catenuloplanes nepalensis TaxID=587533 RepID=A0ABT9MJS4_9ACTN|nr:GNAT family N-acetyltransferase [Catenuloplanes nepalensis]MDP9791665.1 putative acetyltransferase [Catenuloplanes nepalensis]
MEIRQITEDEAARVLPVRAYAFEATPLAPQRIEELNRFMSFRLKNTTLVAEEDGEVVASVAGIPMRQNVRGVVHPMLGVAGVVSHPLARRRGHVRTLMHDLLRRGREEGRLITALHPFRAGFYARLGYVGLTAPRTVTLRPEALASLLRLDLPGEVRFRRIAEGWDDVLTLQDRFLHGRHGFTEFPEYRRHQPRDDDEQWLVTAHRDGEVIGALPYRITDYGGDLTGGVLLCESPVARALILRFLAGHVDQVGEITLRTAPSERPELWSTDFTGTITSTAAVPHPAPPMVRVLDLPALAGLPAGEARVTITVVDDDYVGGGWELDGAGGALSVKPAAASSEVRLTAAALSGLVYGMLGPEEIVARGLGAVPVAAQDALSTLFPPAEPWVYLDF